VTAGSLLDAAGLIRSADRVFVLAGAGMSTESGIPDFRGPDGLWTMNPGAMRMFDLEAYRSDPDVRRKAWQVRRHSEIRTAQPNAGHQSLAAWYTDERAVTIATQNIDGLQQRAGSPKVLELHGTFWQSMCLDCSDRRPIEYTFARLDEGEEDPPCLVCGGILKTGTVAFGQPLDVRILTEAAEAAQHCDVALAIGTSLIVQPAALLCDVAVKAGAPLVVINGSETPYDDVASLVIREPIGPSLTRITDLL
jgi:NAD-dependent deacetylase